MFENVILTKIEGINYLLSEDIKTGDNVIGYVKRPVSSYWIRNCVVGNVFDNGNLKNQMLIFKNNVSIGVANNPTNSQRWFKILHTFVDSSNDIESKISEVHQKNKKCGLSIDDLEKLDVVHMQNKLHPNKFHIPYVGEVNLFEPYKISEVFQHIYDEGHKVGVHDGEEKKIKEFKNLFNID